MPVVFQSFSNIEIDGIASGNIVDVISNHPSRRIEVLAAFDAFCENLKESLAAQNNVFREKLAKSDTAKTKAESDLAEKTTAHDQLLAEKIALIGDKSILTTQLADAEATITGLQTRVAELEAEVIELTPPPAPLSITRYQCTTWLRTANILQANQSVSDLVKQVVTDPEAQLRALDRWELGTAVLRNDPMIETLGGLLGLTTEQLDAAFLVASQIE